VAFKLQNLRQVATGKGLGNVSQVDRAIWEEMGNDPQRVKALAILVRTGLAIVEEAGDTANSDEIFVEGRVVTETHLRRERDPRLRKKLFERRRNAGELKCDVCGCLPIGHLGELGEAIFEAHHILPLAAGEERNTRSKDMAMVCANCHRMVHRAIVRSRRWLTLDEVAIQIVGKDRVRRQAEESR
jgi:5-methylcytosine-specific restriction protein A